jgi:hypothetical protein
MGVRAKFKCVGVEDNADNGKNIRMEAVVDGSPENKEFFRWTPSGSLMLGCVNPAANEQFVAGQEYFIDITPAPAVVDPANPTGL